MARIPTYEDFGQRPSLRSNRVDPVQPEGLDVAEGITVAAQTFARIYNEKTQKDSRLGYALAKNELMAFDAELRNTYRDRQDYENFDKSYTDAYTEGFNEIAERHFPKFTQEDRALFSAESDLGRERGRAAIGDLAHGLELAAKRASIETDLIRFSELTQSATPGEERNGYMMQALETINAGVEEGVILKDDAVTMRKAFAETQATHIMADMEPEDRLDEIQLALLWRERNKATLTPEQAAAGEGSGSIGDFLPLHTLREMEQVTEKEIELENVAEIGQTVSDAAFEAFDGPAQGNERERFAREHPLVKGNAEARNEAIQLIRSRGAAEDANLQRRNTDYFRQLYTLILDDPVTQLDSGIMAMLPPQTQQNLRNARQRALENIHSRDAEGRPTYWGDADDWQAYEHFMSLSLEEMAQWDGNGTWAKDNVDYVWRDTISRARAEQFRRMAREARTVLQSGGDDRGLHMGLTQEQYVERRLIASPFFDEKPTASSDADDRARWMRMSLEVDRQLRDISRTQEITPDIIDRVITKTLTTEVSVRNTFIDDTYPAAALGPEDYENAYIPLNRKVPMGSQMVNAFTMTVIPTEVGGNGLTSPQSPYEFIKNQLSAFKQDNDDDAIEEVWFYVVTQGWEAAYYRWQGLEIPRNLRRQ
jgi:hypothetical protein